MGFQPVLCGCLKAQVNLRNQELLNMLKSSTIDVMFLAQPWKLTIQQGYVPVLIFYFAILVNPVEFYLKKNITLLNNLLG